MSHAACTLAAGPVLAAQARRGTASTTAAGPAARLVVRAAGLDSSSLSNSLTSSSSLLGPKAPGSQGSSSLGPKLSSSKPQISLDDVPLKSKVDGMDYSKLRDLLKEGKWREAEDETRELLIQAAGAAAVKRGWVYFSEVKFIPVDDMQTLDGLWKAASRGKFGYAVQREVWLQNRRQWPKFFKAIDWVIGENNVYRKWPAEFDYSLNAPKGHLPLTNALRGTRLFEAIMDHEAFQKPSVGGASSNGSSNGSQPDWLNK
ncbi:hypothetical protein C2E20_1616 [Micractinium conductrix]|uniref:GUN4-like domain-containing protein n=1 Tax=Micractinium conductrix TaxID=554055 RepID=A0A2P6VNP3_9CHLO|nr:hypothetical protein C2E20_1616 [Micractinium conductrix]|eukprot:PSC75665.1 hypothetical protein C2E20_1616 [Micractinium conductrix]